MARTTFVLWYRSSCKAYHFFPAPHDASCDRCAAPHDVSCERRSVLDDVLRECCAAPHDASPDGFAVLDPVAYRVACRTWVECLVLERSELVLVLEWLAVPEPQHL